MAEELAKDQNSAKSTGYTNTLIPPTEKSRLINPTPSSDLLGNDSNRSRINSLEEKGFVAKTYWTRWFVLLVFCLLLGANNFGWICFSPVTDIITCYYGVSIWWMNGLSWIYMVTYTLFFIPVARFLESGGLRAIAIFGACFNAIGFWIRYAGSGKRYYSVIYIYINYTHNTFFYRCGQYCYILSTNIYIDIILLLVTLG